MTAVTNLPVRRELAHRQRTGSTSPSSGARPTTSLAVVVLDETGDAFELVVEAHEALDAFEHPYAYAAFRGLRSRLPSMSPRETHLLAAATAATALHVLDDATLHREPGTTVADHLIGAGALLAVLAVAATVFPRLRAGAQATLALLLGVLAVDLRRARAGAEIALQGPVPPATSPACSAFAAGVLALALGVRALWRSRRRDGRQPRAGPLRRRALRASAPRRRRSRRRSRCSSQSADQQAARRGRRAADLGRPYEEVTLRTSDGLDLAAWYVPSRNGAAVIAFPGRRQPVPTPACSSATATACCSSTCAGTARARATRTRSAGSARDVAAAVEFLRPRPDVEPGRIGGLGLSLGGELLLQAAARALPATPSSPRARASARCASTSSSGGDTWLLAPQMAVLFGALRLLAPDPRPLDRPRRRISPRPILLIEAGHGQGGET